MGTIQNAIAAGDIYGKEIDLLLWDSGMTERGVFMHRMLLTERPQDF